MKSLKLILLILLLPIAVYTTAQNRTIDSLKTKLSGVGEAQELSVLYELTFEYSAVSQYDTANIYIGRAQRIAFLLGDSLMIVKTGRVRGQVLRRMDKVKESIQEFLSVLPIARRQNFLTEYKYLLNGLGLAYTLQSDYDKALEYHFYALVLKQKEGDSDDIYETFNNIGLVYFKLKDYDRALEYYFKSLNSLSRLQTSGFKPRLLINIGLCYNQLKNFKEAEKYINEGLHDCYPNCHSATVLEGEFGLGVSYFGQERLLESAQHFGASYDLSRDNDDKRWQLENLVYLARISTKENNFTQANVYLKEAESVANTTDYKLLLIEIYRAFSILFNERKDFTNAALYQEKYIHLKDSVYSEELIKNLSKVQTDYAQRENKAIIASKEVVIKQQRDLNLAIAVIAILAVLLVVALQRSNRISKRVNDQLSSAKEVIQEQNKQLEQKNKDLDREVEKKTADIERVNLSLKQVNEELDNFIYKTSHDIRGPLASLKGMCNVALLDVKDPIALDYLHKLDTTAERLNTILTRLLIINQINNSKLNLARIDFSTIIDEVLLLEKKKGLPKKVKIDKYIHNQTSIRSDRELVRIILENLVDNAIKFHNDSERIESFVRIEIKNGEDESVKVSVIDNGIGLKDADPDKLFQMFFRASERSEIGGIGLYIVKTASIKLGGYAGMQITKEGNTEFFVTFPDDPPVAEVEA